MHNYSGEFNQPSMSALGWVIIVGVGAILLLAALWKR